MQSQYREQPRSYGFEDSISPYSPSHSSHHGVDYTLSTPAYPSHYDSGSAYYMTSSTLSSVNDSYYRSVSPLSPSRHHGASHHRYYSSEGPYTTDYRNSSGSNFIPTPSDMANSYNSYSSIVPRSPTSSTERYATTLPYPSPHLMSGGAHRPGRLSTSRPRSGTVGSTGSATSPTGERFPCEKCGKTFSRSHDRKRHHETQHLASPIIHRCRYCEKEFSRADSLKRHVDNGCDEAPQHQRQ
ncbi:hypothetical protein FA13DRAFT_1792372 [Coprinellus micaceus]|uniref:C2H2-type domain-containing protein n=1 Tax=Coprinellus micaceus TaxID=71717 RepID=A0A4Y7T870_COPMI|nr:hypothetical protein FA13DRAFT_1792372 [Coprinellus micaceus]